MWKCFKVNSRHDSNSNFRTLSSSQNFYPNFRFICKWFHQKLNLPKLSSYLLLLQCQNIPHSYFFNFFVLVYDHILRSSDPYTCNHSTNPVSAGAKFFKSQLYHSLAMWPHASFLTSLNRNPLIFKTEIITSASQIQCDGKMR